MEGLKLVRIWVVVIFFLVSIILLSVFVLVDDIKSREI